ncbi:MAG: hypothetical protein JW991_02740 [Candidatus Pacebacteria bacterium]|nr:hypothetical protein [Candidatus Paceibacterota bacterium]
MPKKKVKKSAEEKTEKKEEEKNTLPMAAIALITIGVVALAEKHLPDSLEYWPYALIAFGLIFLFKKEV